MAELAKGEGGEIMAYAAMRIDTTKKIWDAFQAKYPFLIVKQYKADTNKMLERVLTEYRAKKYLVDVLDFSGFHTEVLLERGIADRYVSPESRHFKPIFKGKNGAWTALYYYPLTISYNTNLVPLSERPKNWPDLLDPKWKGKIGMEPDHLTWYGGILKRYGEEKGKKFMGDLAKQEPRLVRSSRGNALLSAGEFAIFIGRGHTAQIFKNKGAPIDWVKDPDPLVVQMATLQLAKNAPHPNSAKLLIDFWLSEEVAQIMAKDDRIPARTGVKGLDPAYSEIPVDKILPLPMEELLANYKKHLREFRSFFGAG
ncbi:MAG TPA: extracellular solute-binding protein [Terriglobales bacterium]|nr:extracellular solute-binding protein [Terriglobales bacterium]